MTWNSRINIKGLKYYTISIWSSVGVNEFLKNPFSLETNPVPVETFKIQHLPFPDHQTRSIIK